MKYQGCLLAVRDISVSKNFYEKVLHQNSIMDIGVHVTYEGFSLQQGYAELVGIETESVKERSHNFQVYFEVEDLDKVYAETRDIPGLQWVHEIKEYPWGQRNIRIYAYRGDCRGYEYGFQTLFQSGNVCRRNCRANHVPS